MKKTYETPKVEKMAFDYSDVVVASGGCTMDTHLTVEASTIVRCEETEEVKFNEKA